MDTSYLYKRMEDENIHYIHHKLVSTRAMICHYKGITAIVVDDTQIKNKTSENTVLIQELGHYMAGAYYKTNSSYELIRLMEHIADVKAWNEFFPYCEIVELMKGGITTTTEIAEYFDVEPSYMARCLYYYYNRFGFPKCF